MSAWTPEQQAEWREYLAECNNFSREIGLLAMLIEKIDLAVDAVEECESFKDDFHLFGCGDEQGFERVAELLQETIEFANQRVALARTKAAELRKELNE